MSQRSCSLKLLMVAGLVAACASGASAGIIIDTVPVGNPRNAADTRYPNSGYYGSVGYTYQMGKYEVTAGQYTAFLNAVAATDSYELYNTNMDTAVYSYGCNIKRTGSSGSYTYSVASDWANRPVNWVSWGDAARFSNWLHNGQPTGAQGLATTEDGSYYLNGATSNAALMAVTRKADATWAIPTEDEWYKAAYHKNDGVTGNYWDYPTSSNTPPGQDMVDVSGNNANYYTAPYVYPIDSGKYTTVGGEFQNSDSPYGTFDQGGNVFEWNEWDYSGLDRGLRGAAWGVNGGSLHASDRYHIYPTGENAEFGFRVAEVPEPAAIVLLASGSVGMLARRRNDRSRQRTRFGRSPRH